MSLKIGIGRLLISGTGSSGSSWTPQKTNKFLEGWIILGAGSLVGLINSNILTVGGTAGNYTFQVPNTSPYINADTDYIWFRKTAGTRRTATESELVSYDFSKTFVKYLNVSPYSIQEVWILASGQTLTTDEENKMRDYCQLSIWWSNVSSLYGATKGNRVAERAVWTLEPPTDLVLTILGATSIQVDFQYAFAEEDGFCIERSTTNESSYSVVHTNAAGVKTWTDNTVSAQTKYYYRVRAYNDVGNSYYCPSVSATTPVSVTTDYANPGGTGDRKLLITITSNCDFYGDLSSLIDGHTTNQGYWNSAFAVAGKYLLFDFLAGYSGVIQEAKFYQSISAGHNTHGIWKWQGSMNGTDFTDIGSSFTLGEEGVSPQVQTSMALNFTYYRYYRLLGISGNVDAHPYINEFEFKISVLNYH
jgi:hypothetical protein